MKDIKQALKDILKMDEKTGIPPEAYVIEECSELTKEIIKKIRGKSSRDAIVDEACDVICVVGTLLTKYEVSQEEVKDRILYKCNRALTNYRKNGEK